MTPYSPLSNFFSVQIPDDWTYEEGEVLLIYKLDNGVGAIQISNYSIPEDYVMDLENELLEFVVPNFENVSIDELRGYVKKNLNAVVLENDNNETFWYFKIMFENNKLLFITYNCDIKEKNSERFSVNQILSSIKIS